MSGMYQVYTRELHCASNPMFDILPVLRSIRTKAEALKLKMLGMLRLHQRYDGDVVTR
jgi:hypothetical protein